VTYALELDDVRSGYGRIEVLHGITIEVPVGSVVALLGRNGVGKTTVLRTAAGVLPTTSGAVRLNGQRINGRRASSIASKGLVLVPEGRGVFPGLTVRENLQIAHHSGGAAAGPWEDWEASIAETFPRIAERMAQSAGSLSGGEQQMLAICRALVGDPSVLMFDELSMGLAPLIVGALFEKVAELRDAGRTIVLVEQYLTHALKHADLCYILAKGQVVWLGEPAELRSTPSAAAYLTA
jgi:branched-chain amino acid transport system ATP-binding protein